MSRYCSFWLLALLLVAGCGGSGGEPPEPVYKVSGVVMFKGNPVVGADITFMNTEKNRSAFGKTDDQGEYRLTTFSSNDGAVEGKSVVTISKFVSAAPPEPVADIESEAYVPPGYGPEPEDPNDTKSDIPQKYASQETSGLVAVVGTGENRIDFDLEE